MRKLCISDLQCFQTFRNCYLFRTFLTFRKLVISDLQHFETFPNCCLFCTFCLLRNFNSGDAHHSDYWELCLNPHSFHCSHCVNKIYSVFKPFEIAVCFGTFGFYEISTPVMRTMLTKLNVVQIIISDIAQAVYIRFTVFSNFFNLQFVLHILAFTKFQLRWYAPFQLLWTLFKSSFLALRSPWKSDLKWFQTFWNCSLFWHILAYTKILLRWGTPCELWQT